MVVQDKVSQSLLELFKQAEAIAPDHHLASQFDSQWRSPSEVNQRGDVTYWQATAQQQPVDFAGLANVIGQPIHPDICSYYGSFWAGHIEASSREGSVSLIQLWNEADFERLIENLVGHFMSKRQLKQPFTAFFANTGADSEFFLSIDNDSGKILLEEPGKPPIKEVETDLVTFLARLTPVSTAPEIY